MKQRTLTEMNNWIKDLQKDDSFQQSLKQGFYKTRITDIQPTRSHRFFMVETYEDKEGIQITVENDNTFFIPIPTRLIGSMMGKFIQKYGKMPEVGLVIDIDTTEHYPRIKLD